MAIKDYLLNILKRNPNEETDAVIGAMQESMSEAGNNIQTLKTQFNIQTAEGEWLDEWGTWFLPREVGETDPAYSARILKEVTKARVTIGAIRDQALLVFGADVDITILEPHTLVFILSDSELSGAHKMADGRYYRTGTVDLSVSTPLPERLLEKFIPVKAGGVIIYITHEPIIVDTEDGVLKLTVEDDIRELTTDKSVHMFVRDMGGLQLSGNFEEEVMGGRQIFFTSIERALSLLVEQQPNSLEVLDRTQYPSVTDTELWEDLFTSASYERAVSVEVEEGGFLGTRDLGTENNAQMLAIQSTEFFTGSTGSVEYWEEAGTEVSTSLKIARGMDHNIVFSHLITSGSVSTISDYANYTIEDLNSGVSFDDYNKFSSNGDIVTTTSPI